jgi:outer membrane protein assembly factor BamB
MTADQAMSDDELLKLLEQKTPQELTPGELELLRARLEVSPVIQAALLDHVQMEEYLVAALGSSSLSPQQIVSRAQAQQGKGFPSAIVIICLLVCLPLVALTGGVLYNAVKPALDDKALAHHDAAAPLDKRSDQKDKTKKNGDATPDAQPAGPDKTAAAAQAVGKDAGAKNAAGKPASGSEKGKAAPQPPAILPAPWQAVMAQEAELPTYADTAFVQFDRDKELPRRETLARWFAAVPGLNHNIGEARTRDGTCGTLSGFARLKSPWTDDSALKLSLTNCRGLQWHFFNGERGVTLVAYDDNGLHWFAYATTRKAGEPKPTHYAIAATDDDRSRRTNLQNGGAMAIRFRNGELVISRGDIVLLAAPFAGLPTDAFFEGSAQFEGIALVRTSDFVAVPPEPPRPVRFESNRPAELTWTSTKPELLEPQSQADGSLRVQANNLKERTAIFTPIPRSGLWEYVFELSDISPGTGVFLGYDKGGTNQVIRFYNSRQLKQLAAKVGGWDDDRDADFPLPAQKPVAALNEHCWLKLVLGCGQMRWWLSTDGVHWAQAEMSFEGGVSPEVTTLGLQVVGNKPDLHITLNRFEMRELSSLSELASAESRAKAIALPKAESLPKWVEQIAEKKPADADAAEWRRACAIQTLAAGTTKDLSHKLLEGLLDDAAARNLPFDRQLNILRDASLLTHDLRDGQAMRVSIPSRIAQLGLAEMQRSGALPWSCVRQAYFSLPTYTWMQTAPNLEPSLRAELILRSYRNRPEELLAFCRELQFFQQDAKVPLLEWAMTQARRQLPSRGADDAIARAREAWRHPLVEELNKETYNAVTEIQAVIESQAWDDAARLLTSLDPEGAPGVAPYMGDRELLASLPVTVQLILEDYPDLRAALGQQFGPLARLRVGQATAAGDAAAVELAAVQFAETDAAVEAHRWLGDRALASGWFERALAEYRRAVRLQPALDGELAPRIRLAAAMLGADAGKPVTQAVQFGEMQMSAAEFESLVAEMRARGGNAQSASGSGVPASVPAPSKFEVHKRSRLDGNVGNSPNEEVNGRKTNQLKLDWPDRQIATVRDGDVLYVSNRFQVAAYNLTNGQRTWQSPAPPGPMQKSQAWACIPMHPLVTQQHIFVRQLYGSGPSLVCLEKSSGKILWSRETSEKDQLVSDPLLMQGQLVALTIAGQEQQEGILRWNVFDMTTGEVQNQRDLVRLRSSWLRRQCCEVAALEDSVVALLGGVALSLDPHGNVRWMRKQLVLPTEEEPQWIEQLYQRPLIADERIYVSQPGVRSVECLDPQTGRRFWSNVVPDLIGIVGRSGERLIVRTEADVRALEAGSGKLLWQYPATDLYSFALAGENSLLLARREPVPNQKNQRQTSFVWLDPATGQPTATTVLPDLNHDEPRLGPLVPFRDHLFTFAGHGLFEPQRDVIELVPKGEAEKLSATAALPLIYDLQK